MQDYPINQTQIITKLQIKNTIQRLKAPNMVIKKSVAI